MLVNQLLLQLAKLSADGKGNYVVGLEVGGDGAIHQDCFDHIAVDDYNKQATLSGEVG